MYHKTQEHLAKRGIELKEVFQDHEIRFEFSASRISSPQRYQLLSLLLLLFTLIYPNSPLFIIGLSIAFWSSRRFKLSVSSVKGVELQLIVLVPYKRIRLPLIDTQIKQYKETDTTHHPPRYSYESSRSIQQEHLNFVSLVLSHPNLYGEPLTLLKADQESAQLFSQTFASWLKLAYQKRNLSSKTPLALFKHEPGEWVVALIDLFPSCLAPKRSSQFNRTRVTWWAVTYTSLYLSTLAIIICCLLIIFQASLGLYLLLSILLTLLFSRESFFIEPSGVTWRKSLLGIPIKELKFSQKVHTKLEGDIHAPKGRHVLISDPTFPFNTLVIGQAWDAAWIYRELCEGLKTSKTKHLRDII